MNKEQYVKFETAQRLKEGRFNWPCTHYYDDDGTMHKAMDYVIQNDEDEDDNNECLCPTQQMACRWLREVHKIDISVIPDDGSWWIKITELGSWSCVFNGKVLNSDDIKFAYQGSINTKEECYEAGLWYVLKILI